MNLRGEKVIQQNITDNIDISYLETGVYFIQHSDGLHISSHKIIKNKDLFYTSIYIHRFYLPKHEALLYPKSFKPRVGEYY